MDVAGLFAAVREQDLGGVQDYLASGGDPNAHDPDDFGNGNTALHSEPTPPIAKALLEAGAEVNARCGLGWTPLHRACNSGDLPLAQLLVANGADPALRNDEGYSPLGRVPGNNSDLLAFMRSVANQ